MAVQPLRWPVTATIPEGDTSTPKAPSSQLLPRPLLHNTAPEAFSLARKASGVPFTEAGNPNGAPTTVALWYTPTT
ncbi:MAG: hypothetical protein GFGODING_01263 [Flavobacteriales bacterium]|nr:hypothetical protein [Flavobacteriales bacterium]